jgi:hypothetical protein
MKKNIDYTITPVIFYRIFCKDPNIQSCYVGHTIDINVRINNHKNCCNNQNDKSYNLKIYKKIRELGGFINWNVVVIDTILLPNLIEILKIEQQYINLFSSDMNSRRAYYNKEYKKIYREQNKEQNKEYNKIYYEQNKEQKKIYREQNKNKLKEYNKIYREQNKEQIKEHNKIYYEQNKEQKKIYIEQNKEKIKEYRKKYYEQNK